MMKIPLLRRGGSVRAHAIVDDEDYESLAAFRWYLHSRGYAARSGGDRTILMHRQIMGFPNVGVDHRNRNKLDNRRSNLRIATQLQNGQNLTPRTDGMSQFRGVTQERSGKWIAQVKIGGRLYRGRRHGLGSFDTEAEAAAAARAFRLARMGHSTEEE